MGIQGRIAQKLLNITGPLLDDVTYSKLLYRIKMGKKLNLSNPTTYNEKLQWLKLYDHNPLYTTLVDKYAVKDYVASKIGSDYIIPTIGVWDNVDEIEWNRLPDQFVLKTTQGGGGDGVVICADKSSFSKDKAIAKLRRGMTTNPYRRSREWPYKDVPHRVIAEQYLANENGTLPDYKFFCFNGEVKAMFIATDRGSGKVKFDYFDADFNHLDLVQAHPMSGAQIERPESFDEMKRISELLSTGIPQVRCDLYEVDGKVYFGELTFVHHGGVTPFHPDSWDYKWGEWIILPEK